MTSHQGQVAAKCERRSIYLPRDVPGEITVGRELELAGLLGPVIHNLNVPGLHKHRHHFNVFMAERNNPEVNTKNSMTPANLNRTKE